MKDIKTLVYNVLVIVEGKMENQINMYKGKPTTQLQVIETCPHSLLSKAYIYISALTLAFCSLVLQLFCWTAKLKTFET